jgi:hypothetical protein
MHPPDSFSTNRPLYLYHPPDTPLDTNFNTKLAPLFMHLWTCRYAEIKSSKVSKGQNLHFLKVVASFQENERFYVAYRSLFEIMNIVRFLPPKYQNESALDDWSVIVQSAKRSKLCKILT